MSDRIQQKQGNRPLITLVGGTGTVGKPLTQTLLDTGTRLRILTRNAANARALWPSAAIDIVEVNFDDPGTLRSGLLGSDRVFVAMGTSDRQVRDEIALIDAAVQAEVGYIVALSVACEPGKGINKVHEWHQAIDSHLEKQRVAAAWLKPTTFTGTLGQVSSGFIRAGAWGGIAGEGRLAAVDARDVSAAAAQVLMQGEERHAGRSYDLSGPSALSMPEFAGLIAAQLGKPVTYAHRTRAEQRAVLEGAGVPELFVEVLLGLDDATRANLYETPSTGVFDLTGKEPRSVESWIAENISIFR